MKIIFGKLKNGDWVIGESEDDNIVKSPHNIVIMPNKAFVLFDMRQGLTKDDVEIKKDDFLFICDPQTQVSDAFFQAKTGIKTERSSIINPNGSRN